MDAKVEAATESLAITLEDWPTAEAVLRALGEKRDWKKLERATRILLRQKPDEERERTLWRALGGLYRDQLHDDPSAIEVFEILTMRDPPDVADYLELAMLHERNRRVVEALEVLDASLARLPSEAALYQRRFELCAAMGDVDGAWRSAAALFMLDKIDFEHANFYADHELREPRLPIRAVTPDDFLAVRHHQESAELSEVLKIARVALPKRLRRTIEKTKTQEELYLLIYYRMCDLFPQYELVEESLETLDALTIGASAIFGGEEGSAATKMYRASLERALGREQKDQLARAVGALLATTSEPDLAKWRHAARVSCANAGALLIGDPNLIKEPIEREPAVLHAMAASFASAHFGRQRADLGVGLTPPA